MKFNRILAFILSIILIFGALPSDVLAASVTKEYYGLFSDEQSDGGFEYGGWKVQSVQQKSSFEIIDTDRYRGKISAYFNFQSGGGYKEIQLNMDVPAGTAAKIKTYKDYCWTAYLKVSSDFMGSVSLNMVEQGAYTSDGLGKKQVYIHSEGRPLDWTRYNSGNVLYSSSEIEAFLADKTTVSVVLSVRGSRGNIKLDDLDFKQYDNLENDDTLEEKETFGDFEGNLINSGFESGNWTVKNQTSQMISLDSLNGQGGSQTSLKVQMSERMSHYTKAVNFTTTTINGVDRELNTTKNYRVAIWAKTSDDFVGSVSFQVLQNGQKKWYAWETELHIIGNSSTGVSGYDNWTYLYTPAFAVTNDEITVTLIVNGVGTIWFDNARIILDPEADYIISNSGFEGGVWSTWGSDNLDTETVETDTKVTYGTAKAAKLTVTDSKDANVFIVNTWNTTKFDPDKTYVLSFALKYEGVEKSTGIVSSILQNYNKENADGTITTASKWYRYKGSEQLLKTGGGSSDWQEYRLILSASGWADGFASASLYFYLQDKGTLWVDSVMLTESTKGLDLAEDVVTADFSSGELECETVVGLYTKNVEDDIWYTVDGTDPTYSKTALYYKPGEGILVTEDLNVKACVKNNDGTFGVVAEYDYICNGTIIPDDVLWAVSNNAEAVSLDTDIKIKGENSVKISGDNNNTYISTGEIPIDSFFDYKLSFWVKTKDLIAEDRINLKVFLTSPVSGGDEPHPLISNLSGATIGDYGESFFDFEITQDWTCYEVDLHSLNGLFSSVNIILTNNRSHGDIWIDGVSLVAVPKKEFPLKVEYSNEVLGNIYTESIKESFDAEQSFYLRNYAKTCETGVVSYKITNDINPENVLSGGEIAVSINGGKSSLQNVDISSATKYGTYTIEFTMETAHGAVYDIGLIHFSRIIDNTELMENGTTFLGVCGTVSDDRTAKVYNVMGTSMMRMDYDWLDVEKQYGVYTIHESKDSIINTMLKNNIEPMIIFNDHGWPSWMEKRAWPTTDHDVEHFLGYIRFIAESYKGRVKYYEFYNEVDYRHWRSPDVYPDAVGYTELMKKVYAVLKEVNPEAVLIGGVTSGINPNWARAMLQNGAADYMDAYSVHPYIQNGSPESSNWHANMQELCDILKEYSGRDFPLFITEIGWPNSRTTEKGNTYHDTLAYSIRTYTFGSSLKSLEKIVTYCISSGDSIYSSENQYGMMRGRGFTALPLVVGRAAYNIMHNGFELDSSIKFAQGLYAYKYTGEQEDMYVLWTDDIDVHATINTSCKEASVYDIFGNPIDISYSGNKFNTIVGKYVIYVRLPKGETINAIDFTGMPQDFLEDTLLENAGLEKKPPFWTNDSTAVIDITEKCEGNASLKLMFMENGIQGMTFVLSMNDEKVKNLDSSVNYRLKFRAKSDGAFKGNVIVDPKIYGDGVEFFGCNWTYGTDYLIVNKNTIPTEWTEYVTEPFPLIGDDCRLLVNVANGVALSDAVVWLDRFEIVPVEENTTNGTINATYNKELGKTIVTVTGRNGYLPMGLTARCATGSGKNSFTTIPTHFYEQTDVGTSTFIVDFGERNKYYQGQSFKLFEAEYIEAPEPTFPEEELGDATGDGKINILDLVRFKNYLEGKTLNIMFINVWFDRSDSKLGATDFAALRKKIWNRF